tara:strand:+ start:45 stop:233 length:189 start_codon:yes stop_codon:yes gene_type:complete
MCNKSAVIDLRYLWNGKTNTYELEYHCTTLAGGCDFYRILPLYVDEHDDYVDESGKRWRPTQ